ncbi:MAG TPA: glutaredoxin family protein [Actinomycetes bacterium]|nr:glutaredoxin family protein [Actinomycetes bacterium]
MTGRDAGASGAVTVTLYTRTGCHLCERAEKVLRTEQEVVPFNLATVDIDEDPELVRRYGVRVPVVAVEDVELFEYEVPVDLLRAHLRSRFSV